MNGIIFFRSQKLEKIKDFYLNKIGCKLWLKQTDCLIFQAGNMLLGFCDRENVDQNGIITFFYPTRKEVDAMYRELIDIAQKAPIMNSKYNIYQFFALDPEGRTLEFQWFKNKMKAI